MRITVERLCDRNSHIGIFAVDGMMMVVIDERGAMLLCHRGWSVFVQIREDQEDLSDKHHKTYTIWIEPDRGGVAREYGNTYR